MSKIIGIVQVKGGAGRSTLATNLAAIFAKKIPTALIDCDMPQGTSASWFSVRKAENKTDLLDLITVTDHTELVNQIEALDHKVIILDAPPRIAEVTRAMLLLSDLIIIPLGASAAEIWATSDLLNIIEQAKQAKPNIDARIVWNKYRGYTNSAKELSSAVKTELNLPEFKTKLGYRVAYADALGRGLTVAEWSDKNAKNEIIELANEIIKTLK